MKRRSFLAALGLAPIATATVKAARDQSPATEPLVRMNEAEIGAVRAGVIASEDAPCPFIFESGQFRVNGAFLSADGRLRMVPLFDPRDRR